LVTRKDFDFTNGVELRKILKEFKPEIVVNAAGRVAGIQGNIDFPVELMTLNVLVSTSIMQISNSVCFSMCLPTQ
jgi:dTDP-4-dehydrorhamnose reductase